MHEYSTDARDRNTAPLYLAAGAVAAAYTLHALLSSLDIEIPWWIDAPSVMGFYGILFALFDNYAWRIRIRGVCISSIPDVRGTWVGYIDSSYQDSRTYAVIYIRQTWSRIGIRLQTAHSQSHSTMAALNTEEVAESGLKYEYINEPSASGVATMQMHRGSTNFKLSHDSLCLSGDYYTGRGRNNFGRMVYKQASKKLLTFDAAIHLARSTD